MNCKERGGKEGGGKLVLPGGTPVLWMCIGRFSQFNIISSKAAGASLKAIKALKAKATSRAEVWGKQLLIIWQGLTAKCPKVRGL